MDHTIYGIECSGKSTEIQAVRIPRLRLRLESSRQVNTTKKKQNTFKLKIQNEFSVPPIPYPATLDT